MNKLNRYLSIALVIQLVVLLVSHIARNPSSTAKPTKLFDKLDVEKVNWLRIEEGRDETDAKKKQSVVELAKEDGKWVLKSGGDFPAKKDKITEFLGKLPGLIAGQPVATSKRFHRKLEVADDKYQRKVAVKVEDGRSYRFVLGSSPAIKSVHLRLEGKDDVYLVKDLTAWDASATPTDWVESDYFKVKRDNVVALTLVNKNGEIKLSKGADGKWTLEGMEEGATLKQSEVDSLLSSASSVNLQQPVGREVKPSYELGQEKASARLTVEVEQKPDKPDKPDKPPASMPATPPARVTHTLTVGAKKDDSYYVKSGASQFVVRAATWAVEPLVNKKPTDLWEKKEEKKKEEGSGAGSKEKKEKK
jgi:hypothetical protein